MAAELLSQITVIMTFNSLKASSTRDLFGYR